MGFVYGMEYFRFREKYYTKDDSIPVGTYIIAIKWWNIKFNWYTRKSDWFVSFEITIITNIKKKKRKEYSMVFSNTGIRTCIVNIN